MLLIQDKKYPLFSIKNLLLRQASSRVFFKKVKAENKLVLQYVYNTFTLSPTAIHSPIVWGPQQRGCYRSGISTSFSLMSPTVDLLSLDRLIKELFGSLKFPVHVPRSAQGRWNNFICQHTHLLRWDRQVDSVEETVLLHTFSWVFLVELCGFWIFREGTSGINSLVSSMVSVSFVTPVIGLFWWSPHGINLLAMTAVLQIYV